MRTKPCFLAENEAEVTALVDDLPPTAWIIEPSYKNRTTATEMPKPYMTLKADVAVKRFRAGDFVTPYHTQHEGDEL